MRGSTVNNINILSGGFVYKKEKEKLIIFYDVDGTLAEPFESPPDNLKKLVKGLDEKGIIQVLCSGRNHEYLAGLARGLDLKRSNLVIAENGGVVFDWRKLKVKSMLDDVKSEKIISEIRKKFFTKNFYEEQKVTMLTLMPRNETLLNIESIVKKVNKYCRTRNMNVIYQKDGGINIFSKNINKGVAVKWLMKELGYQKDKVITCGDGENDMEMLSLGFPLTFSNANPNLKKLVRKRGGYITKRKGPNGLVEAISYLLAKGIHKNHAYKLEAAYRPWGEWEVISRGKGFKVKKILVRPGHRLSLQKHQYRSEHWFVSEGEIHTNLDNENKNLIAGESIFISAGQVHRFENRSKKNAQAIEISMGEYLEEDDIIRLEDDYERS